MDVWMLGSRGQCTTAAAAYQIGDSSSHGLHHHRALKKSVVVVAGRY